MRAVATALALAGLASAANAQIVNTPYPLRIPRDQPTPPYVAPPRVYAADPAPPAAPAPAGTLAIHNGSVMTIRPVSGNQFEIVYQTPRPGLAAIGVTPGTLLVAGRWVGTVEAEGFAHIFWPGCPAIPYRVAGGVDQYGVLTLRGPAPQITTTCTVVSYEWASAQAFLRFDTQPPR